MKKKSTRDGKEMENSKVRLNTGGEGGDIAHGEKKGLAVALKSAQKVDQTRSQDINEFCRRI